MSFSTLKNFFPTSSAILTQILELDRLDGQPTTWYRHHRYSLLRILYDINLILLAIRFVLSSIFYQPLEAPVKFDIWNIFSRDYLIDHFIYNEFDNNRYLSIILFPAMLVMVYLHYLTFYKKNHFVWNLINEMMIENGRDFWQLNPNLRIDWNFKIKNFRECFCRIKREFSNTWNSANATFQSQQFKYLPDYSDNLRIKGIMLNAIWDQVFVLVQWITGIYF